jgi:hypothetical protein
MIRMDEVNEAYERLLKNDVRYRFVIDMSTSRSCLMSPGHPVPELSPRCTRRAPAALGDPHAFWLEQARRLDWVRFPTRPGDWSFDEADFHIRWYADGELNLSVNCLDRHLATRGDRTALVFEGDEPGTGRTLTYRELHEETCRFANLLKERGVGAATG